jgi:hypothetical protein
LYSEDDVEGDGPQGAGEDKKKAKAASESFVLGFLTGLLMGAERAFSIIEKQIESAKTGDDLARNLAFTPLLLLGALFAAALNGAVDYLGKPTEKTVSKKKPQGKESEELGKLGKPTPEGQVSPTGVPVGAQAQREGEPETAPGAIHPPVQQTGRAAAVEGPSTEEDSDSPSTPSPALSNSVLGDPEFLPERPNQQPFVSC